MKPSSFSVGIVIILSYFAAQYGIAGPKGVLCIYVALLLETPLRRLSPVSLFRQTYNIDLKCGQLNDNAMAFSATWAITLMAQIELFMLRHADKSMHQCERIFHSDIHMNIYLYVGQLNGRVLALYV